MKVWETTSLKYFLCTHVMYSKINIFIPPLLQLKSLTYEELQQRMSSLDTDMEREIEELRKRYQSKRHPIIEAMELKKRRQTKFWACILLSSPTVHLCDEWRGCCYLVVSFDEKKDARNQLESEISCPFRVRNKYSAHAR